MIFLFKNFFLDIQPLVAVGTVIVNDVETNCLVGGVPAKFIK